MKTSLTAASKYGAIMMTASAMLASPAAIGQTNTSPAPAPGTSTVESDFSEQEIQQFAMAVVKISKIRADMSVAAPDKQAQMATAVQEEGLAPQKFNAIAEASQSDAVLQQKIQSKLASLPPSGR